MSIKHPIQQRLLALSDNVQHLPAFERLTGFQRWRQWPLLQMNQRIADTGLTQSIHPHQQSTGIVLAPRQMRGVDQRLRGAVQIRLITQNRRNRGIAQR
ncbi:hypothetical protein D3C81_1414740 [compost metagenome]